MNLSPARVRFVLVAICLLTSACNSRDAGTSSGTDREDQTDCDLSAVAQLAEMAVAELGYPAPSTWQTGLAGPLADRIPTAHDLAVAAALSCEWEGYAMSGDGEWVLAVAAWDGGDILGLVALTEPPRATLETESDYWFEQTGVISGAWKTPSIFAGQSEDGPTALFKSGTVQLPSTPRDMTTTTVADFSICPQVAPTFLPHGVEGGPGNQPGVVWQAAGTLVVISYTTNPAHPAVNLSGGTSLKFVGGSARYASLRPDDPQSNFIALIDLDGLDPACGSLTAEFHSLVAEEVEQVLTSLVVVAASN